MKGYLYRGSKRDLGLGDLETINAAILASRPEGAVLAGARPASAPDRGSGQKTRERAVRSDRGQHPCGTIERYYQHYKDGEAACRACKDAYNTRRAARKGAMG